MTSRNRQSLLIAIAVFAVAGIAIYMADYKPDFVKNALGTHGTQAAVPVVP